VQQGLRIPTRVVGIEKARATEEMVKTIMKMIINNYGQ
jgi:hypothetical protein